MSGRGDDRESMYEGSRPTWGMVEKLTLERDALKVKNNLLVRAFEIIYKSDFGEVDGVAKMKAAIDKVIKAVNAK